MPTSILEMLGRVGLSHISNQVTPPATANQNDVLRSMLLSHQKILCVCVCVWSYQKMDQQAPIDLWSVVFADYIV